MARKIGGGDSATGKRGVYLSEGLGFYPRIHEMADRAHEVEQLMRWITFDE